MNLLKYQMGFSKLLELKLEAVPTIQPTRESLEIERQRQRVRKGKQTSTLTRQSPSYSPVNSVMVGPPKKKRGTATGTGSESTALRKMNVARVGCFVIAYLSFTKKKYYIVVRSCSTLHPTSYDLTFVIL